MSVLYFLHVASSKHLVSLSLSLSLVPLLCPDQIQEAVPGLQSFSCGLVEACVMLGVSETTGLKPLLDIPDTQQLFASTFKATVLNVFAGMEVMSSHWTLCKYIKRHASLIVVNVVVLVVCRSRSLAAPPRARRWQFLVPWW